MENNIVSRPIGKAEPIVHPSTPLVVEGGNEGVTDNTGAAGEGVEPNATPSEAQGEGAADNGAAVPAVEGEGEPKDAPADDAGEGEAEGTPSEPTEPDVKASGADEDKEFGKRFAQLSKRESDVRVQEATLKEREKHIQHAEELKSLAKEDPFAFMEATGISYDQLTKSILDTDNAGKDPELAKLKKTVSSLEQQLSKDQDEKARQQYEASVAGMKAEIGDFVTKSDKYPYAKQFSSTDEIYDVIEQTYRTQGSVLSYDDALASVEEFYREQENKWIDFEPFKKTAASKWNGNEGKAPTEPPANGNEPPNQGTQAVTTPRTLTNNPKVTAPTGNSRPLSREERIERAASLLRTND